MTRQKLHYKVIHSKFHLRCLSNLGLSNLDCLRNASKPHPPSAVAEWVLTVYVARLD